MGILQLTLAGKGWVERAGERHESKVGDLMMVTVPDDHVYGLPSGKAYWEFIYLCIKGETALQVMQRCVEQWGPLHALEEGNPVASYLVDIFRDHAAGWRGDPYENSGRAWQLVTQCCSWIQKQQQGRRASRVEQIPAWLEQHMHENIGIEEMASLCGFSRYHFTRLFRERFGLAPSRYVEQCRIRRAVALLQEGRLPIAEVGERCGYGDPNYFARVFRKAIGEAPREFQRRLG